MYAQLRGNNQGIIKITTGGMNRSSSAGPITVERDTRLSAVLNGKGDAGMLVLSKAAEMASNKCKGHGFGVVGTNHTSTSTGCLAFYAEKMAKKGLIGVVLAQSPEFVAPAGPIELSSSLYSVHLLARQSQHVTRQYSCGVLLAVLGKIYVMVQRCYPSECGCFQVPMPIYLQGKLLDVASLCLFVM